MQQSRTASTGDNVTLGPASRVGVGARGWGGNAMPRSGSNNNQPSLAPQAAGGFKNSFDVLNSDNHDENKRMFAVYMIPKGPYYVSHVLLLIYIQLLSCSYMLVFAQFILESASPMRLMPNLMPQAPSPKGLRPHSPSAPSPMQSPKSEMNDEEFRRKAKAALEEYYEIQDENEVCLKKNNRSAGFECILWI